MGYRTTHRLDKTIDQRMVARTHEQGWLMHYLVKSEEPEDWKTQILQSPGRFVLEHMGGVAPAKRIEGEACRHVFLGGGPVPTAKISGGPIGGTCRPPRGRARPRVRYGAD